MALVVSPNHWLPQKTHSGSKCHYSYGFRKLAHPFGRLLIQLIWQNISPKYLHQNRYILIVSPQRHTTLHFSSQLKSTGTLASASYVRTHWCLGSFTSDLAPWDWSEKSSRTDTHVETQKTLPYPGISLGQAQMLQPSGEWNSIWKLSFPTLSSLSLALTLK